MFVNLCVGSRAELLVDETQVTMRQATSYPWNGTVKLTLEPEQPASLALHLRLPGWCLEPQVRLNGRAIESIDIVRGYARVERSWQSGDEVELLLPMPVRRVKAHLEVEADRGRVALQRGPVIYCLEGCDNGSLRNLVIPPDAQLSPEQRPDLLGGVTVIRGTSQAAHRVTFPPVATEALRIEVQLQQEWSGGILEWRAE